MNHKELVRNLRGLSLDYGEQDELNTILYLAANAIEELQDKVAEYSEILHEQEWIPFKTRHMTEEELKEWNKCSEIELAEEDSVVFLNPVPDDGQEVLVYSKYGGCSIDTFISDQDGCYLENNGDFDGIVAWMPLPRPPKGEE